MTATVHQFSDLVQRREIQRLEAAVKASNNVVRIGSNGDFRPHDYIWPREQSREMRSAEVVPIKAIRPLWHDLLAVAFLLTFLWLCVVGLPVAWG